MRIAFLFIFALLGANLVITLLDSSLIDVLEERKQTIENVIN